MKRALFVALMMVGVTFPAVALGQSLVDTVFDIDVTNPDWQSTGIMVGSGDRLYLAGFVAAYWNDGHRWENVAAGAWQDGGWDAVPAPGHGYGIVVKVGDWVKGVPQMTSCIAPYSGELLLAYNDVAHGDNEGKAICAVMVTRGLGVQDQSRGSIPPSSPTSRRAFPSPAVRSVSVAFDVARAMDVDLGVYDLSGALVRRLPTRCVAGTNHVLWNGTDDLGREVATGVYYYSVKAEGEAIASGKVTLAK